MLKKQLLLAGLLLMSAIGLGQQVKKPYYYQTINNGDKSVDFVFGFYPATLQYFESKEFPAYTSVRSAIFNKSAKQSLKWNDFRVDVLLKSGNLIRNYAPFSKEGIYGCTYTVPADSTHYQVFCFHTKFIESDIDKVWLQMSDDEIFGLTYDKNE